MKAKDTKNLYKRGKIYYLKVKKKGIVIDVSLNTSEVEEARTRRDQYISDLLKRETEKELLQGVKRRLSGIEAEEESERRDPQRGIKLEEAFEIFAKDPERRKCGETQMALHKSYWGKFLEWINAKHPDLTFCRQITQTIIREWAKDDYNSVKATNTYNKHRTTIHYVFEVLCAYDDFLTNPVAHTHGKPDKADRVIKEPFTEEELRKIFAYPEEEFCRLCAIGLYSTLRFSSARFLKWENYKGKILEATHDKTGADATQEIAEDLKYWLERVPPQERHGYICPSYAKRSKANAVHYFQTCLQSLGIQTQKIVKGLHGKMRKGTIKGFHSFRHTAVTLALKNGATPSQVQRLAGHKTLKMQAIYTHLGADDAGKAAKKIGRFW